MNASDGFDKNEKWGNMENGYKHPPTHSEAGINSTFFFAGLQKNEEKRLRFTHYVAVSMYYTIFFYILFFITELFSIFSFSPSL